MQERTQLSDALRGAGIALVREHNRHRSEIRLVLADGTAAKLITTPAIVRLTIAATVARLAHDGNAIEIAHDGETTLIAFEGGVHQLDDPIAHVAKILAAIDQLVSTPKFEPVMTHRDDAILIEALRQAAENLMPFAKNGHHSLLFGTPFGPAEIIEDPMAIFEREDSTAAKAFARSAAMIVAEINPKGWTIHQNGERGPLAAPQNIAIGGGREANFRAAFLAKLSAHERVLLASLRDEIITGARKLP
jgi:hypothetical protein